MDVKSYDFFAEGKKDFYNKFTHKSILCQGHHLEKTPLVTIIITTYKRPELLRQAVESALNQKRFDDYQILIIDNEGVPVEVETATAKVVKDYQDEKIIYYRHSKEVAFKSDYAIRLARSPWVVFLHDDDMLDENHLAIMTGIVKRNREIKFLGCNTKEYMSEHHIVKEQSKSTCRYHYVITKLLKDATCFGNWTGWLGALISRRHYIAIGGMPVLQMGCGDKVMVCKFLHHYGTFICNTNRPLYYYRIGEQQSSYAQKEVWEQTLINEYCFEKYVINKYHRYTHKIWERNLAYCILQKCEFYNHERYHAQINIDHVIDECEIPADIRKKNFVHYAVRSILGAYRKSILHLANFYMQRLKKSDIRLEI